MRISYQHGRNGRGRRDQETRNMSLKGHSKPPNAHVQHASLAVFPDPQPVSPIPQNTIQQAQTGFAIRSRNRCSNQSGPACGLMMQHSGQCTHTLDTHLAAGWLYLCSFPIVPTDAPPGPIPAGSTETTEAYSLPSGQGPTRWVHDGRTPHLSLVSCHMDARVA